MLKTDMAAQLVLTIAGMNWLLIGLLQYDVVTSIFGGARSAVGQAIYVGVGLCALWMAFRAPFLVDNRHRTGVRAARSDQA